MRTTTKLAGNVRFAYWVLAATLLVTPVCDGHAQTITVTPPDESLLPSTLPSDFVKPLQVSETPAPVNERPSEGFTVGAELRFGASPGGKLSAAISWIIESTHGIHLGLIYDAEYGVSDTITLSDARARGARYVGYGTTEMSLGLEYTYRFDVGQLVTAAPSPLKLGIGAGYYFYTPYHVFELDGTRYNLMNDDPPVDARPSLLVDLVYRVRRWSVVAAYSTIAGVQVGVGYGPDWLNP